VELESCEKIGASDLELSTIASGRVFNAYNGVELASDTQTIWKTGAVDGPYDGTACGYVDLTFLQGLGRAAFVKEAFSLSELSLELWPQIEGRAALWVTEDERLVQIWATGKGETLSATFEEARLKYCSEKYSDPNNWQSWDIVEGCREVCSEIYTYEGRTQYDCRKKFWTERREEFTSASGREYMVSDYGTYIGAAIFKKVEGTFGPYWKYVRSIEAVSLKPPRLHLGDDRVSVLTFDCAKPSGNPLDELIAEGQLHEVFGTK
jgi:hypothetical protein